MHSKNMSFHYFPQEILVEILIRLPVKSICRFIIVSKSWHALITSPSFISGHLHFALNSIANHQQDTENKTLILGGDKSNCCMFLGDKNEKLNFPFDGCFRIVGSSNGLLCLASELPDRLPSRDRDELTDDFERLILWNPSIRRSLLLPWPNIERPLFPHIVFGFGNNLRDGEDYIVVRIVYPEYLHDNRYSPEVEVYSLKTRVWKKVVQPGVRCRIMPFCKSQVLVNGRLHWLAFRRRPGHCLPQSLILAFDLTDEVFSEIMLPYELGSGDQVKLCYNLFEESLTVIENRGTACCIWTMKEYGVVESWTITYSFDLARGMESVVAVLEDGEVLVQKQNNELVLYDIKTSTIKDTGVFGPAPSFDVHRHVESLLLLRE